MIQSITINHKKYNVGSLYIPDRIKYDPITHRIQAGIKYWTIWELVKIGCGDCKTCAEMKPVFNRDDRDDLEIIKISNLDHWREFTQLEMVKYRSRFDEFICSTFRNQGALI